MWLAEPRRTSATDGKGGGTKTKYQSEEGASVGDQRVRELLMPSGLGEESDL